MQTKSFSSLFAIRSAAIQAMTVADQPAPVELDTAAFEHVAGGLLPQGTWASAASTTLLPQGTW